MELQRPREAASLALSLLDLTNLKEDCTPEQIASLCQRAHTQFGNTAAICIWPRFVAQARAAFGNNHSIRIATVVNFPSGDLDVATVVGETERAIRDGADEIDLVIPYRKFIAGDEASVVEMVAAVRKACPEPILLKVILETGELKDKTLIRRGSEIAIAEGADFIKDLHRQGRGQCDAGSGRHHAAGHPRQQEEGWLQACWRDRHGCRCDALPASGGNHHAAQLGHALHLPRRSLQSAG